ncbi:hypothetical protein [Nannocystis punicea]|uniref:Uncharacterized protein n=1 Tax=Nannocystis punicea TaxID=2995304 RepID=A0ABY7HDP4_9BACT|nr:hypothetical protein [Nannocystis poenicansa]WAS97406.1 hypothetical protein O0S08_14760 [Nannocystis poenicansa]
MIFEDRHKLLARLYHRSFVLYRASGRDRGRLHQRQWARGFVADDDDDPLGTMELLAVDVGGYVSTLAEGGMVRAPAEALRHLRRLPVVEDPELQRFARDHGAEYPNMMRYLRMLERCRREAMALLAAVLRPST